MRTTSTTAMFFILATGMVMMTCTCVSGLDHTSGSVATTAAIYLLGGEMYNAIDSVNVYFPSNQSWSSSPSMLTKRYDAGAAVVDGRIYVIGGISALDPQLNVLNTVEMYDPLTMVWSNRASKKSPSYGCSTVVLRDTIFAIGGAINLTSIDVVEQYDPTANKWTTVAPLLTPRTDGAAVAYGDSIIIFGGINSDTNLNTIERYDPVFNRWQVVQAVMPYSANGIGAAVIGPSVLIFGGRTEDNSKFYDNLYSFDPVLGSWTQGESVPMGSAMFGSVVIDNSVFLLGGRVALTETTSRAFKFNALTGNWATVPSIPSRSSFCTAVVAPALV